MVLTDLAVVGGLGSSEFAAVGLAGTIFSLLIVTSIAVLAVIAVLVAEERARNAGAAIGNICGQGFWIVCLLAVPFGALLFNIAPALNLVGVEQSVIRFVFDYSRALVFAVPFALVFVLIRDFLVGIEDIRFVTFV